MNIKQLVGLCMIMFLAASSTVSSAKEKVHGMAHHKMAHMVNDSRISLELSPQMKQHQLANMRSHLEAVQRIVGLIAVEKFEQASVVAHAELGLTEEMRMMCDRLGNEDFRAIGFAFHESADVLGEVLKTKDTAASLRALDTTMSYCIQCHAAFRQ